MRSLYPKWLFPMSLSSCRRKASEVRCRGPARSDHDPRFHACPLAARLAFYEIRQLPKQRLRLARDIVANIVMLGALVGYTHVVSEEALKKAILDSVPKGTGSAQHQSHGTRNRTYRREETAMKLLEYRQNDSLPKREFRCQKASW